MKTCEKLKLQNDLDYEKNDNSGFKFEISSSTIEVPYLNLIQYSQIIQEAIKQNDIFARLATLLQEKQKSSHINESSIKTFLRLLNNEEVDLKNEEFSDLIKLSDLFKVTTLEKYLQNYLQRHSSDIDLILSLKISQERNDDNELFQNFNFSSTIEDIMKDNINECFENDKINQISISTIYRILDDGCKEKVSSELLYHFISESIEERYVLFKFVQLEELTDESFEDICSKYEKSSNGKGDKNFYYEYMPNNLKYIKILKDKQKSLEERIKILEERQKKLDNENEKQASLIKELNTNIEIQEKQTQEKLQQKENEISELKKINQQIDQENKAQNNINDLNAIIKTFVYNPNDQFNGIISSFPISTREKDILVDSSSKFVFGYGYPRNVLKDGSFFKGSNDDDDFWLRFDFQNKLIEISSYTLYSTNIKNWNMEISNDGNTWEVIDYHSDYTSSSVKTNFQVQKKKFVRFCRIHQTGPCSGNETIRINRVEFFGRIIMI